MIIQNYEDFITALKQVGFSMGSGNGEGVFSLCSWFGGRIRWHTEDPNTDPWEWRMRVLDEREDIAYAKVFFHKSGYITKEWYPCFLAARRSGLTLEEAYEDGTISRPARKVYDLIRENGSLPTHRIKKMGGFLNPLQLFSEMRKTKLSELSVLMLI